MSGVSSGEAGRLRGYKVFRNRLFGGLIVCAVVWYIYLVVIALPKREELRGVPMGTLEDAFRLGVNVLPRSPGRSISDGEKMRIEGDRVGLEVLENGKAFEARAVFDGDEDDAVDLGTLFYIETTDGCKAYPEVCRASEGDSEEEVLTLEGRGWNKKRLRIDFECRCDNDVSLSVKWTGMVTAIERTESLVVTPVARVAVRIISDAPLELKSLLLLDIPLDDSKRSEDNEPYKTGVVDGSPVVIPERSLFCGLEHPRAKNTIDEGSGRVAGFIRRPILDFGYSAAVGKFDPRKGSSSLFKTFADYVEMIRAAPYHSWLHYNTWYDLRYKPCIEVEVGGKDPFCEYSKKFTEDNINQRIDAIATSLEKNGVKLDGVLLDDGWDDWDTLWGVNKKAFPRGDLSEVARRAQEKHGVKLGVWMSPFGGYQEASRRRIMHGLKMGYEIDMKRRTFNLAGKKYSKVFSDQALKFVENDNVVFFKFDGIAGGQFKKGADNYAAEVDSLLRLILDIRKRGKGNITWINLTIGTWPSPYWLIYGDSIWKDGYDVGLAGWGNRRDMHITERDASVYQNVVQRSMLMPIANLMLHGILQSRANEAGYLLKESISDLKSFKTEVFTYFLSGVGLQELYIQPEELTDEHWRVVAEGAQFHRSFQSVLRQVQWIGGDPEQGQLYGWAACNDTAGVFGLRNPTTFQRKARVTLSSMWGVLGNSTWQISPLFESPAFPIESSVVLLDRELSLTVSPLGVLAYRASRISS